MELSNSASVALSLQLTLQISFFPYSYHRKSGFVLAFCFTSRTHTRAHARDARTPARARARRMVRAFCYHRFSIPSLYQ